MLSNLSQTVERLEAIGVADVQGIQNRITTLWSDIVSLDSTVLGRFKAVKLALSLSKFLPRISEKTAECQESIRFVTKFSEITLNNSIDSALLFTTDPHTEQTVYEKCRVIIDNPESAKISFSPAGKVVKVLEESPYRMPAAICVECDKIIQFAAETSGIPDFISPLAFAGFLSGKPVILKKCMTQKVAVPSNTGLVIEGYVQKSDGLFHISCTSHRKDVTLPLNWFRP